MAWLGLQHIGWHVILLWDFEGILHSSFHLDAIMILHTSVDDLSFPLPSCLFSHISFVSVKIPLKKIARLCFVPGVGAGHGCLEGSDLLEEWESALYSAKAAAKRCLVL